MRCMPTPVAPRSTGCPQPLACWNCALELRRGHGCLSLSFVCCQVEISAKATSSREVLPSVCARARVCVYLCVITCNNNTLHIQWADRRRKDWERKIGSVTWTSVIRVQKEATWCCYDRHWAGPRVMMWTNTLHLKPPKKNKNKIKWIYYPSTLI